MAFVTAPGAAQTLPQVVERALQAYPSIQSAIAKVNASRADIDKARSAHQPQIGLTASSNQYASGSVPSAIGRTSVSPTAKLNLWSGGRIEAEATRAEALTRAAEFQRDGTLDDVAQQACEAYLNWDKTADLYSLAVRNVNSHRETLEDIQKIAQVDTGRRIDYEQALVRMENATLALQQRKADLTQAMQKLRRFWPDEMDARPVGLDAVVSENGVLGQIPMSMASAMDRVTDDLPMVAQARAQVQAAEAAVKVAKGQYWPSVDAAMSRQFNTNTLRFETFSQLQLNAPLYTGGATSALIESALGQLKATQFSLDEARLIAREKAGLAWQEWASARARSSVGSAQSDVGDKLVEGYRQQFRVARRSLLDLLNIQADSFNYRSAARAAFHDERLSRVRLLAATGDLARRFSSEPGRIASPSNNGSLDAKN
ncbi:TolC family protein [Limnohabitans lacus]|uniref:TolC family protein n=1 Tax=Limnohabitans lacus TaxID=3045173 RepID=A0ABT6X976_9BURK|nr:TolC family protein [Limnohabitans sp. HM2-2]MDI9234467.1 TolC family protein [Limnohabitans sp. HM2-2]